MLQCKFRKFFIKESFHTCITAREKAEGTQCSPAIICVQRKDPGFEKLHHLDVQVLQGCEIKVGQFVNDSEQPTQTLLV